VSEIRTIVKLKEFEKQCEYLGLDDEDMRQIENIVMCNTTIGKIIQGTGGARKMRIPLAGKGKSGGGRVIYIDFAYYEKLYLLAIYSKKSQDNMSKAYINALKTLIKGIEAMEQRQRMR